MPVTTLEGRTLHVDEEGFLTELDEWNEDVARALAAQIGITLTDKHLALLQFLRKDFAERGETPTTRRVQLAGGVPVPEQFALFPGKPAKKMAYVAGLPKPHGCV
jgi:TusE/DsrC/DsvC family sulfur relay protein